MRMIQQLSKQTWNEEFVSKLSSYAVNIISEKLGTGQHTSAIWNLKNTKPK